MDINEKAVIEENERIIAEMKRTGKFRSAF